MSRAVVDPGAVDVGTQSRVHLVSGRPLFFPFPSGTLTYSCQGCDAPCCKGEPLGIGRSRELVTILQAQPKAALFATPGFNGGPLMSLSPPPEKCWFLDRKQRCRLEYVLGREQKPTGCRLFPFSVLTGLGETLAVLPDLLCPVTTSAPTTTGDFSHDALALEMARTQVPRSGHPQLDDPDDLSWDEAMALERRVVAEADVVLRAAADHQRSGRGPSAQHSFLAFCELMAQLTASVVGFDVRPSAMALVDADTRRFLGTDDPLSPEATADLLTFVGTLRLRPIDGAVVSRRALPSLLTALSVLVASYDGMRGSRRTVRSLAGLWDTQGPVLYTLAHLGARPLPRGDAMLDDAVAGLGPLRPAFSDLVEGIRHNGRRSIAITVEELLRTQRESFAPPLTVDAVGMLHALGRVLREACTFTPI